MSDQKAHQGTEIGSDTLLGDVSELIEQARRRSAKAVNSELVTLYWSIGKRVREEVLGGERAAYGQEVIKRLAAELTARYGRGYAWRNLMRMVKLTELYPDPEILSPVATKLTWTNITELLAISDQQKRDFYLVACARDGWTKRVLRERIDSKLFERTLAANGASGSPSVDPEQLASGSGAQPGIVFRDPYVLDFLDLPAEHSELELETAILGEVQRFLLELGAGFTFVGRQKRIVVDGEDYHLDLLLFHREMQCLVAVELKTRKLQPADYGQMMLYLRWLDRHERLPAEAPPVGLILCTEKGSEQVKLLGLDSGEIRAAQYLTHDVRVRLQHRLDALTVE